MHIFAAAKRNRGLKHTLGTAAPCNKSQDTPFIYTRVRTKDNRRYTQTPRCRANVPQEAAIVYAFGTSVAFCAPHSHGIGAERKESTTFASDIDALPAQSVTFKDAFPRNGRGTVYLQKTSTAYGK